MGEHAVDKLPGHLGCAVGVVIERGDGREDRRPCLSSELHIAQMNAVEGGFAHAEDERAALLEADVCGAMNEVAGEAICYGSERSHRAGKDDHGAGAIASAGDAGPDVRVAVLAQLAARLAEEFLSQIVSTAELKLFRKDAQGAFRGDEMDAGDAIVLGQGAKHLCGVHAAAGSGNCKGDVAQGCFGIQHKTIIAYSETLRGEVGFLTKDSRALSEVPE